MTNSNNVSAAKDDVFRMTEHLVEQLAFERRCYEALDGDLEEYDSKMNEWCEKYHNYFKDMDLRDLTNYMVRAMMKMEWDDNDGKRL